MPNHAQPPAPATGLAHEGRAADLRDDARADAHDGTFPNRLRQAPNTAGIPSAERILEGKRTPG